MLGLQLWKHFASTVCKKIYAILLYCFEFFRRRPTDPAPRQDFDIPEHPDKLEGGSESEWEDWDLENAEKMDRFYDRFFPPTPGTITTILEESEEEAAEPASQKTPQWDPTENFSQSVIPTRPFEALEIVWREKHNAIYDAIPVVSLQAACRGYLAKQRALWDEDRLRGIWMMVSIPENKFQVAIRAMAEGRKARKQFKTFKTQKQVEKPTAFPRLGQIDTCECWMVQDQTAPVGVITHLLKLLFGSKHLASLTNPLIIKGFENACVVKLSMSGKQTVVREVQHKSKMCGNLRLFEFCELDYCHLNEGEDLEKGHDLRVYAGVRLAGGEIAGIWIPDSQFKPRLPFLEGIEANVSALCDCIIPFRPKRDPEATGRPEGYKPLWARPPANLLPRVRPLTEEEDQLVDQQVSALEARVREYTRQFGSRTLDAFWFDTVESAFRSMREPLPPSANTETKYMRDVKLPAWLKRRVKAAESKLAKAAAVYGGKIAADKSFKADTYQEWAEQELRRYEAAAELSAQEYVKAMPQLAREWLKTADAKHRLNTMYRNLVDNPAYGAILHQRFNKYFTEVMGGMPIRIDYTRVDRMRREKERLEKLREAQLEARDARTDFGGAAGRQ